MAPSRREVRAFVEQVKKEIAEKASRPTRVRRARLPKEEIFPAMVCFVDLLGFGTKVKEIASSVDLYSTRDELRVVHDLFLKDPKGLLERESAKSLAREVWAFSDCLVIVIPLRSQAVEEEGTLGVIVSELNDLSLAHADCMGKGILLRGGVSFGLWFRQGDFMISPALVEAHDVEQEVSLPVIGLAPRLKDLLVRAARRTRDPRYLSSFPKIKTKRGFCRFLDYCGDLLAELPGDMGPEGRAEYKRTRDEKKRRAIFERGVHRQFRKWLRWHRNTILNRAQQAGDGPVRRKYEWLKAYHNRHVKRCGKEFRPFRIGTLSDRPGPIGGRVIR